MEKVKFRRIKYKDGDVFYVPYPKEGVPLPPEQGAGGEYIPLSLDKVSIGQVITSDIFMYIAIYEETFLVKELPSININSIVKKSKVIFLISTNSEALRRGWWPILGNFPIRDSIPMQAYSSGLQVIDYKSNLDNSTGHIKSAPEISKKLIRRGIITSVIVDDIAAYYNGEISNLYNYSSKEEAQEFMDDFIPREEGLVWKVFPEFYNNSWKESKQ